jgi:hypothetical protein
MLMPIANPVANDLDVVALFFANALHCVSIWEPPRLSLYEDILKLLM